MSVLLEVQDLHVACRARGGKDCAGAMATLSSQCRRLVELLFLETSPRQYTEVAAELDLTLGSIGFTRQKCSERLRQSLHDQGFH